MLEEVTSTSTWSARSGNAENLEEETVDILNAAGYEAYHVTSDSYGELESTLYTDFGQMGLDPDGSYLVVISGEEEPDEKQSGANSRIRPEIDLEGPPDHSGAAFKYIYNGNTYYMRYATVTGDSAPNDGGVYTEIANNRLQYMLNNLFTTTLVAAVDSVNEKIPLGTIASLLFDQPEDYVYLDVEVDSFAIHANSQWTCEYIQVWDSYNEEWCSAQFSETVYTIAYCAGFVTVPETGLAVPEITEPCYRTIRSYWYDDIEKRKEDAMKGYDKGTIYGDSVTFVKFSLGDEKGEILFNSDRDPLFTHKRGTANPIPD